MDYYEYMSTILGDYFAQLAMEEDFDEEDPYEDLDPEDDDWDEPDWDLEEGYNPYMGCYDFDC